MMSLSSLLVTQEVVSPAIEFNRLRLTSIDIDKQTQYDTKTNNNTAERFAMAGFNLENPLLTANTSIQIKYNFIQGKH